MFFDVTKDGGIAKLVLHHPPLNILTRDVLRELHRELERLEGASDVRVLVLAAAGKHFSAGADVGEHLPPDYQDMIPEFMTTVGALDAFPQPVIAAVQGKCLGGAFELVQAADVVLAGEGAAFGQPEIMLGVIAPAACVLLPERVGRATAAELLLTGDPVDAERAARLGIVLHVVPDAALESSAMDLAGRMARHSRVALALTKRVMRTSAKSRTGPMAEATAIYVDELMQTEDAQEGLRAFVEKRQPVWSDR